MTISATRPGANDQNRYRRAAASIGARATRSRSSSAFGGGITARPNTHTSNSGTNNRPVTAGIQYSLAQPRSITLSPTDFTTPDETMKLAHSMAPRTSETRRPSRKPNTRPQIIPNISPSPNRQAMLNGGGM